MSHDRTPLPRQHWILLLHLLALAAGGGAIAIGAQRSAELDEIAAVLDLRPGMVVADVGAGDGRYAWDIATRVGESGHVFATEVDSSDLQRLQRQIERRGLQDRVTVVTGTQQATGLDRSCCDAILLRNVYHHFADPGAMRESMQFALRPAGTLLVVDFRPSNEPPPRGVTRGGHGLAIDALIEEMSADGWVAVRRIEPWEDRDGHYGVLFRSGERDTRD